MLNAEHVRNGNALPYRWGYWHIAQIIGMAEDEGTDIMKTGEHIVQGDYTLTDPADGEVMTVLAGDVFRLYCGGAK